jgi:peptidoglycan/LPS O-acetylase OafA/YrhL
VVAETPAGRPVTSDRRAVSARAPGLDGVRALAVLAVLAFHQNISIVPAGFLGVDVFFVLSGYLITDLLAGQWDAGGRIDLRGFWTRRAARLLPALAVMVLAVTAAVAVIAPDQASALRPALLGALSYTSNWWQAAGHQSYFATFGPPPPLQHLWSLAVEEQFYLLWPLVLAAVVRLRSRALRAALAWLGAVASAAAMAAMYVPGSDPSRVYYGTDTHASALLIGAALALTWPLPRLAAAPPRLAAQLDAAGVAGLMLLAWATGHFAGADPAVYPAGLILAALAAGCVVVAAAGHGVVAAMLSWRPLTWLGIRSYGIYLWHWPVIALGAAVSSPGGTGIRAHVAETALPIVLAALSWRWIEMPVMRDGLRSLLRARRTCLAGSVTATRQSALRARPVTIMVAVLLVTAVAGYGVLHPAGGLTLPDQLAAGARISAATRARPAAPGRPGWPAPLGAWPAAARTSGRPAGWPVTNAASIATGPAIRVITGMTRHAAPRTAAPGHAVRHMPGRTVARRATRAGMSTPRAAAGRRRRVATRHRHVHGTSVTAIGDSVMLAAASGLQAALPGIYIDALVSRQMSAGLDVLRGLAESGGLRRIVVVGLGTNGTVTGAQLRQLMAIAGPHRRLVLVNTFVPRPWQDEVNGALAAAARRHPNVVVANWHGAIEHRVRLLWDDGVHPRTPGGLLYARVVRAAIRAALDRPGNRH